jgi:hypothetical protein
VTSSVSSSETFCSKVRSGAKPGGVGQRAGLGDRADPGGDAPSSPRSSRISFDRRAVLALELARAAVDGDVVGVLGDLDAQAAEGVGRRGAGHAARHALQVGAAGAAGQADALGDAGDRADLGVLALVPGDEQNLRPRRRCRPAA